MKRNAWLALDKVHTGPDGHIDESDIKKKLDNEVPTLPLGGFTAGSQVDLCYVIRNGYIHCYHCYGLLEDAVVNGGMKAEQVSVTEGGHSVNLLVYYTWKTVI